ncbi:MAG: aspartate kinase [Crocinitomicaceae bacterium]|nr:aspartate kinase [Crocinitomicaceae bacterium]|tara:strand:+ start:3036 stop:4292 length:1257 start_codon:yes stop_codon:yes gene_type:complete
MKVFKFGGASVKDAESIKNVCAIVKKEKSLVIVISAMGKTTNKLEHVVNDYFNKEDYNAPLRNVFDYHKNILHELFPDEKNEIWPTFQKICDYVELYLKNDPEKDYDKTYDQIVPIGELLSSKILSSYLSLSGINTNWLDIRKILITDSRFRKAVVNWEESEKNTQNAIGDSTAIFVTQGFIGGTSGNLMTTLGREGSDYSAAVLGNMLNAKDVTVWKDVPGILNADPRYFNDPKKLDHISYKEAIELSFYGATIIHPKTIKPLQNKNIPLKVRSFMNPSEDGTMVNNDTTDDGLMPIFIYKPNQVLISLSRKDFDFLEEQHLSDVFDILHSNKLEVNIMQNSAINFSICLDYEKKRIEQVVSDFQKNYRVLYNANLELLTIRHYDVTSLSEMTKNHEVLLEQKTRSTLKLLMRNLQE